jgi:hypothetical protein
VVSMGEEYDVAEVSNCHRNTNFVAAAQWGLEEQERWRLGCGDLRGAQRQLQRKPSAPRVAIAPVQTNTQSFKTSHPGMYLLFAH